MNFNKLNWHDSEILDIYINRKKPGIIDEVEIKIFQDRQIKVLTFQDCLKIDIKMNFGVISSENILDAFVTTDSSELLEIKDLWNNYDDVDLSSLKMYQIETNSTNSFIKIFSKKLKIEIKEKF